MTSSVQKSQYLQLYIMVSMRFPKFEKILWNENLEIYQRDGDFVSLWMPNSFQYEHAANAIGVIDERLP